MRDIPRFFVKRHKLSIFHKYAECSDDLEIDADAMCYADHQGNIKIGKHCRICAHVHSQDDGKVIIGDHTCIYRHSVIGSVNSICIGSCVVISNHVHIYDNNNHPTSPALREKMCRNGFDGDAWRWKHSESKPIIIEDNVWIGEYATVCKGVTVGKGSVIASHAVVTKNVPPYSVVAGNPAKVVKELKHES